MVTTKALVRAKDVPKKSLMTGKDKKNIKINPNLGHIMGQWLIDWSISFQLLISGSLDSLDVDDLRTHTTYSSGYHKVSSI